MSGGAVLAGDQRAAMRTASQSDPVRVDALSVAQAVEAAAEGLSAGKSAYVVGVNAAVVNLAARDEQLWQLINQADIALADGIGVAVGYRVLGTPLTQRAATPDFVDGLMLRLPEASVYLVGTTEHLLARAMANLRARGVQVVGGRDGFFDESQDVEVCHQILDSNAQLVLVGMPSPRKERLGALLRARSSRSVLVVGVGGYLDVLSGAIPRAPRWTQRLGLEWAFRLAKEPRRLAHRYLVGNVVFVCRIVRWRIGSRVPASRRGRDHGGD